MISTRRMVIGVVVLAVAGYLLYPLPPMEKQLRGKLEELVSLTRIDAPLPVFEAASRVQEVKTYFAKRVDLDYHATDFDLARTVEQSEVKQSLLAAVPRVSMFRAGITRVSFQPDDQRPKLSFFLIAEWKEGDSQLERAAEDVTVTWAREEGEWRIVRVETRVR